MANAKADLIHKAGVSMWLDSLSREMLDSGWLKDKINSWGLRGQTSNPTIFEKAASSGNSYDPALRDAASRGLSKEQACWELMISDVQRACDLFAPLYKATNKHDGYVSLELDPTKADDTQASIEQGHEIWKRVDRPNLMLKVPGTSAGLPVIAEMLSHGYNVNVTLLFSVERYREVMEQFLIGLERRAAAGQSLDGIASVASFFVSRVDGEVDKRLEKLGSDEAKALLGKAAVANARLAYEAFEEILLHSDRFARLREKGAQIQRPLWASTSTKNPSYPDTLYVDELIGPHCVNTLPENTLEAALDHGKTEVTLNAANLAKAREELQKLKELGIDMHEITNVLLVEDGVQKFSQSYLSLLDAIDKELQKFQGAGKA
jgi:transaldolase